MRLLFYAAVFLCQSILVWGQDGGTADFPKDFLGIYKGTLTMHSPGGVNEIPMEFHLEETANIGTYRYVLVYGQGDNRQERDYRLIEQDSARGRYIVDEQNGILLDDQRIGNRLYSLFEVKGNLLTTFMTFEEDHMVFEIVFAPRSDARTTYATSDSTRVLSYPVRTVQRALLTKQ